VTRKGKGTYLCLREMRIWLRLQVIKGHRTRTFVFEKSLVITEKEDRRTDGKMM
jgi:hypothetical protein